MNRMRLDKFLAQSGAGTRSEVKKLIRSGRVQVNGCIEKRPEAGIDAERDEVCKDGRILSWEPFVWLMFNKPQGCVTATSDRSAKTVMDYIGHERKRELFPVGRLDVDTEGLLLFTNDGALAHRMLAPSHHVEKTYFVRVEGALTQEDADAFCAGVDIGEKRSTLPAGLHILKSGEISEAELTITEGKFHQVKRMFAARGKHVIYLKRTSMGGIRLDETLAPGEWRALTKEEKERLNYAE